MNEQDILAGAPDSASTVDMENLFFDGYGNLLNKNGQWSVSCRNPHYPRSIADIQTIVELRKQVAELEATVDYMERVHNKIVGAILDLDEMEQDSEEMANAEQDLLELAKSSKVYGVPSEYRDISGEKNLALEDKIAELEKELSTVVSGLFSEKELQAHNLEQQALMCDWIYTNIPDLSNKNYIAIKNKAKQLRERME